MIVEAAAMGLPPSEFWRLSGPEIDLQLKGGRKRQQDWYELGLYVAYHVAMWSRVKKMPAWSEVRDGLLDGLRQTRQSADPAPAMDARAVRSFMQGLRTAQSRQEKRKGDGKQQRDDHRPRRAASKR